MVEVILGGNVTVGHFTNGFFVNACEGTGLLTVGIVAYITDLQTFIHRKHIFSLGLESKTGHHRQRH